MNDKLTDRTEEQIKRQSLFYKEVYDLFNNNGYNPIMTGGSLLGTVRGGDFIKWDWDGEFMIRHQEISDNLANILLQIERLGYAVKHYPGKEKYLILIYDTDWYIEIFVYYKDGKYYRYNNQKIPVEYLDEWTTLELRGNVYRCPKRYKSFLYYTYADWKIVRRERDCCKYLTKDRFEKGLLDTYKTEEDSND